MNYERYTDVQFKDDYHYFSFDSVGLKGKLKKVVRYSKLEDLHNVYNLALGTVRINKDGHQYIDGKEISNNGDRNKILATVALTAFIFMDKYPTRKIYVRGIDAARTRLYQMAINQTYKELSETVIILGDLSEDIGSYDLHRFERGVNYTGFLIVKK